MTPSRTRPSLRRLTWASFTTRHSTPSSANPVTAPVSVNGAKRSQRGSARTSSSSTSCSTTDGLAEVRRRRSMTAVQQFYAQPGRLGQRQPVQDHPVPALAIRGSGADRDPRQAEQSVQQVRRHVDCADAVQRRRQRATSKQPAAQLDAVSGDPVAGGEPADERDHGDDDRDRRSPHGAGVRAVSGEQCRDDRRQRLARPRRPDAPAASSS